MHWRRSLPSASGLFDQTGGDVHVRHHQKPTVSMPSLRAWVMCCSRNVALGAVGGNADGVHAEALWAIFR